jgi:poly(A) polymerase/tRNA nucleotidyltransferase (CCA-adding enzyme)
MVGPNDILIPNATPWLNDPGAQQVCRALTADGAKALFVGGCVRNALMGLPDSDIDIATDARPEAVMALANQAGLNAVPTGIEHGTVTVVVDGVGYEVTTFRKDVETDGRRAVVAFSDDIEDDARRRDFTMNALYATPAGDVIDPLGGMPDLLARRVVFIEDADARIREDYLRILRFFRFSAYYADPEIGFDPATLDAIARNAAGLSGLSAERIGAEMIKLLAAPDPAPSVAAMKHTHVLQRILPGADDVLLAPTVHLEQTISHAPAWDLRLAALGGEDAENRLRLSKKQATALNTLIDAAWGEQGLPEIAYRSGADVARKASILRAALAQRPLNTESLDTLRDAANAVFPVKAADLMPGLEGAALGQALKDLEAHWIASGFTLSRADLLRLI